MNLRIFGSVCVCAMLLAVFGKPQEVPEGVRYKKAPDKVNAKATATVRKLLNVKVPDKVIQASLDEAVTCGPMLWDTIKKVAPDSLKEAARAVFVVPNDSGAQQLEGRVLRKPKEKSQLWLHVLALHHKNGQPKIRKAKAAEIQYYWALIPYDIEEPFLIADYGKTQLLFHFRIVKDEPKLFFVDVVGKFVEN